MTYEVEAEGKVILGGSVSVTNSAYTYESSGSLLIGGCADHTVTKYIHANFKEGDVAYEAKLAERGNLEKLIIKKIIVVTNSRTGFHHINYIDTLNAVYLEEELVDHQTAIDLATEYYELQQSRAIEALENSCG